MKSISVLSLFDGMSGGQQAIERLGIKVDKYISSEVDNHAMNVTRYNYPNTVFIGSVTEIQIIRHSKYKLNINGYIVDYRKLILIGGSPCQGFSFAGKMCGASTKCQIDITTLEQYLYLKESGFEFEGQSYLFWEYIRIKRELEKYNSKLIFLLENVKMTKKWEGVFNNAVGIKPTQINSSLVSAQNRVRLYWSNLGENLFQPENFNVYLSDIVEKRSDLSKNVLCAAMRGRYLVNGVRQDGKMITSGLTKQYLEVRYDGKSNCLTTVQKDNNIIEINPGEFNLKVRFELNELSYRNLTEIECERLQTIKDNYTKFGLNKKLEKVIIPKTQRLRMIGNGWTIEVISFILKRLIFGANINSEAELLGDEERRIITK